MHIASISRSAFTNDFDYSSGPSREGSIQIVEPHRHTFSVPTSDDDVDSEDEEDEVQIASSVHGETEEISAATTPDRQAIGKTYNNTEGHTNGSKAEIAPAETRSLNIKGPSLRDLLIETENDGSSQDNPINLESVCKNFIDVDTESEDDGPEVLPFHESSKSDQSNRPKTMAEPQVFCQNSDVITPTVTSVAEKKHDQDTKIHRRSFIPETQTTRPGENEAREHKTTSVCAESTDDFDSEDEDRFDYNNKFLDDEVLEQVLEPPALAAEIPTTSKPKVPFQVGNEKPNSTILNPPFDEFRPTRLSHLSASNAIDVSQSAGPSSTWTQRAPSPSDAALARKVMDPKASFSRGIFNEYYEPQWPAAAKPTYLDSSVLIIDDAAHREELPIPFTWPELQTPEPRSYDQGPFSSIVPRTCSPLAEDMKSQIRKATVTSAEPHEDSHDFIMHADPFARTGKGASKIAIPSLVEDIFAENPRSFKRKYGGMNGSNDVESASKSPKPSSLGTRTSGCKRTFVEANSAISWDLEEESLATKPRPNLEPTDFMGQPGEENATQQFDGLGDHDSPLPDAQPREDILQTPTASMSQDSVGKSALGSVAVTIPVQGQDAEGPARKKARTSSSSSGGIGKFVMGVGFGLLGAATAFVATIPSSVYDEALREYRNAARD